MPDLDYVTLVGRFGIVVGDGIDVDDEPDVIWCDEGEIRLVPLNGEVKIASGSPVPWTGGVAVVDASIDTNGYLSWRGKQFVQLVDLTSDKVNPTIPANKATHRVEFRNVKADSVAVSFTSATVRIAADTVDLLTGTCDLTKLLPVQTGNPTPIYSGPRGTGLTGEVIQPTPTTMALELTDGTTTDPITLPVGPGGSDAGVAGYLADEDSDSRAILDPYLSANQLTGLTTEGDPRKAAVGAIVEESAVAGQVFNALNFGVVADGVTDDRPAIDAAAAALVAFAGKGEVLLPAGVVALGSVLTLPDGVQLRGRGMGATTLRQNHSGSLMLGSSGTMPTKAAPLTTLTASTTRGATTIALASTAGLAADDVVMIGSDTPIPGETTKYLGEFVHIKSVDSSTQITVYGMVREVYTTAANAAIWKPSFRRGVGISDLSLLNPNPGTTNTQMTKFTACRELTVERVEIIGADNPGIAVTHCYGASISGVVVRESQDSDAQARYGYGVLVQGASEGISVTGCHFDRVRHGFTTDGVAGECGQPHRVVVSGCTASHTTLPAFDTHPAGRDILFTGCVVSGGSSDAFQIRSSATRVIGCSGSYITGKGVYVTGLSGAILFGVAIMGNVFRNVSNHGMQVRYVDGIVISGNDMDGTLYNGVDVSLSANRVVIQRNRIFNAGQNSGAAQGIQFQTAAVGSGSIVTDNTVGNFASGEEPGITPGGTRYGVWIGAGTTGAYVADNKGIGLITGMISDAGSGSIKSNNRQLDKVEAAAFPNGIATRVKAGTPADADFVSPGDGIVVVDSTGSKLWARVGGVWKSATLT